MIDEKTFSHYYGYIEDIRQRLYGIVILFMIFFVVGFFSSGEILKFIISFFNLNNVDIVTTSPFQFMELSMNVGVWVGLVCCAPFIIYHLYDFLRDGLSKRERKYFFLFLIGGFGLFFMGFAYILAVLYFYLDAVAAIDISFGIKNIWDISSFLSQVITAGFFFGLVFQFPVVLTFLIRARILTLEFLKRNRRYAIAGIFLIVGLIPPPDLISTLIEAFPLILLYEMTIQINSVFSRSLKKNNSTSTQESVPLAIDYSNAINH